MIFISCSYLIPLAGASKMMLNRGDESEHFSMVFILFFDGSEEFKNIQMDLFIRNRIMALLLTVTAT